MITHRDRISPVIVSLLVAMILTVIPLPAVLVPMAFFRGRLVDVLPVRPSRLGVEAHHDFFFVGAIHCEEPIIVDDDG